MGEYPFIASAIFSIVNGTVLLCVNPRRIVNQVFFVTSVWIAVWLACIAIAIREGAQFYSDSNTEVVFWVRCSTASGAFLGWFIWLMRSALMGNNGTLWQVSKETWLWFCASLSIAMLAFSELYIPSSSTPSNRQYGIGYGIYVGVAAIGCIWFLFDALRHARILVGIRKIEMHVFVLNLACACLLVICSNLAGVFFHLEWLKRLGPIWFFALHGLTVWAVCYHRIFDAKHIILSVGQRFLLFSILGIAAVGLETIVSNRITSPWSLTTTTITICVLMIVCDRPMRRWMGLDRSHILLTPRRKIIDWARGLPDEDELRAKFKALLQEWCQTSSVLFFSVKEAPFLPPHPQAAKSWMGFSVLGKDGGTTPEMLQRAKPSDGTAECMDVMSRYQLGALLAVPKGSASPSLLIGLGQKAGLRPYTFPEISDLLELTELMDNILTHTRAASHAAKIERLASATMISRGLAHDLNNLATPVSTFLQYMEQRITAGTIEAAVLADAKSSIWVMQNYIQESLFFARRLVPNFEVLEAHSVLGDVVRLSAERAHAGKVQIIIREKPDFRLEADLALLRRLLQNLVFNGIDASPEGGTIEITAISTDDKKVCFRVSDQGSGIPEKIRSHIFEPYYTTKNGGGDRRGIGLGLAICQKIIELHGGEISASDNSPHGTVFTAIFPVKNEATIAAEPMCEVPPAPVHRLTDVVLKYGKIQSSNRAQI